MKKNIILLFLFSWTALLAVNKNDNERYIDKYKYIAISEMERAGVPASIKLAQGILESNAGKSVLAQKAKNHFGIKCGSKWKGKKHHRKDDDYKNGKLIKSCFRVYKNPATSYMAHSDFLLENGRYRGLFELDILNYKKWAKELKKAGYATSKTYDKKLIRIIETYQLYKYDQMASSDQTAKVESKTKAPSEVFYINDAKVVLAKLADTPQSIAKRTKTNLKRILKYNEALKFDGQPLETEAIIFLQEKRRNFRGKKRSHKVRNGETMYDISQKYGICLSQLYKKNKMSEGAEPATGASIRVRGKAKNRPRLKYDAPIAPPPPVLIETRPDEIELEEETETNDPIINIPEEIVVEPKAQPEKVIVPVITTPTKKTAVYHTVIKGETLWRISKNYGTTVETITKLNNLQSKIISVGMRLRVE